MKNHYQSENPMADVGATCERYDVFAPNTSPTRRAESVPEVVARQQEVQEPSLYKKLLNLFREL